MKTSKTKIRPQNQQSSKVEKPFFGRSQENDFFSAGRAPSTPFFQPKVVSPLALQAKTAISETEAISETAVQRMPAFESELTANEEVQRSPEPGHLTLPLQTKLTIGQPIPKKASPEPGRRENNTGLPDNLKSGIENLSGYSMDEVKVHYNSDQPAQLQAHAYAQGTDIHLASGQEKHLPHEAWHVVQQKQGRVKPTMQMKGRVNINDDAVLEKEADMMGAKAFQSVVNRPEAIQMRKLQKISNNRSQEKQANQLQAYDSTRNSQEANVIQLAPPGIYIESRDQSPLNEDKGEWERPKWLAGAGGGSATMREYVWGDNPAGQKQKQIEDFDGNSQVVYQCPICGQAVSFMGASVDHREDWKQYAQRKGAKTIAELDEHYHDMDNLWIVHSGCNSSKGNVPLDQVLAREHNAISPATWDRDAGMVLLTKMIGSFKATNTDNDALVGWLDKLTTRIAARGLSLHNAVGLLKRFMGEAAFNALEEEARR